MNEASLLENLEEIKDLKQSIILLMTSQPQPPPLEAYDRAKQIQFEVNDLFQRVFSLYSDKTQDTFKDIAEIRKQITFLIITIGLKTIKHLKKEFDDLMAHAETYATTLETYGFNKNACEHLTKLYDLPKIINGIANELFANHKILDTWRKSYDAMDHLMPNVMKMTKDCDFIDYMEEIQKETGESYDTIVEKYVNSQIMRSIRQWFMNHEQEQDSIVFPTRFFYFERACRMYKEYLANPRRLAYIQKTTSRTFGRPRSKLPRQTTGGRHKSRKCKNGKTKCKNGKTKYRH